MAPQIYKSYNRRLPIPSGMAPYWHFAFAHFLVGTRTNLSKHPPPPLCPFIMTTVVGTPTKEIQWIDAWIRWDRVMEDDDEDEDAEQESTSLPPTDASFAFANVQVQGFPSDSEQVWNSTGLTLWRSAETLCQYLVDHPQLVQQGQRVLELGSGLGLCGLVAHQLAGKDVTLTDGDSDTMQQLRQNIAQHCSKHELSPPPACHQLLWGQKHARTFLETKNLTLFDVVIGSDLVYVPQVVQPLCETVQTLLHRSHGIFLLTYCSRRTCNSEKQVYLEDILETFDQGGFDHKILIREPKEDIVLIQFQWKKDKS